MNTRRQAAPTDAFSQSGCSSVDSWGRKRLQRDLLAIGRAASKRENWQRGVTVNRAAPGRGEWTSNIALVLAPLTGRSLETVADQLRDNLGFPGTVELGAGLLNFRLHEDYVSEQCELACRAGASYGRGSAMSGQRAVVEFVSADPTGPLPFWAAHAAAKGDALCRLLEFQGAAVTREYYLNDVESSAAIRLLGESVAAFYERAFDRDPELPEGVLDDAFVRSVADAIVAREGNAYLLLPEAERAAACAHHAREAAVQLQRQSLENFGVRFDVWSSESALRREGRVDSALRKLEERGHLYRRDGGVWLRSKGLGDEADRPLVRANGEFTYLAGDIAYHLYKLERGFDLLINIWPEHHRPYVARSRAALEALGYPPERLEVLLCAGARLVTDGAARSEGSGGGPLSLDEVMTELDSGTLRFLLLQHEWDTEMCVDTDAAARDDESNPAYAARLAPDRLETLIGELEARANAGKNPAGEEPASVSELRRLVARWPDEAETAARLRQPQRVARFVLEMAAQVRQVVGDTRIAAVPDPDALLLSCRAGRIVLHNALNLLGVRAN